MTLEGGRLEPVSFEKGDWMVPETSATTQTIQIEVNCNEVYKCNNSVSINCGEYDIAISNGTESIASYLLEQCNARHECLVPIRSSQCVYIQYSCRMDTPTLETKKSSTIQIKTGGYAMGLMSEDYRKGLYQTAQNINCIITFARHENEKQKEIQFDLYDFAPFINSRTFCLNVTDSMTRPFCSGSKKYFTRYGPFDMKNKAHLSFTLTTASEITQAPAVRFWFYIYEPKHAVFLDNMECVSKPVTNSEEGAKTVVPTTLKDTTETKSSFSVVTIITSTVLGAFLLVITVAFTLVTVLWCRQNTTHCLSKHSNGSGEYDDIADEDAYMYIDLESIVSSVEWSSRENIAEEIPGARLEVDSASQASVRTHESRAGLNFDFVPRGKQLSQSDPKDLHEMPVSRSLRLPKLSCQSIVKNAVPDDPEDSDNSTTSGSEVMDEHGFTKNHTEKPQDMKALGDPTNSNQQEEEKDDTSQEPHDYLEVIADPEEPETVNEENITGQKIKNDVCESGASKEPNDYLELIGDPEDLQQQEDKNAGRENANTALTEKNHMHQEERNCGTAAADSLSEEYHDYLELIGDPEDSQVVSEIQVQAEQDPTDYTSLSNSTENEYTPLRDTDRSRETNEPEPLEVQLSQEPQVFIGDIKDIEQSGTAEDHHEYLELIGDPEPMNAEVQIQTERNRMEDDAVIENEYTSLITTLASEPDTGNDAEHSYISLGTVKCVHMIGPREQEVITSQDPEDQFDDGDASTAHEFTSLSSTMLDKMK